MRGQAAFETFAAIHLTTDGERAIFRAFSRAPWRPRSVADVASSCGLELSVVRAAFERLERAGIVEEREGAFSWREPFRYVFSSAKPPSGPSDPVCGMPVDPETPLRAQDVFGRTERFCSERCLASFLAWPTAFSRPASADVCR